jgi:hypothetical protein
MASTYSTNLGIELIGTGDQAGAWGNTTNTNLGTLIEQAISGYVTQAVATGTDTTITIPNGSSGVARNMYIELTGTGGTNTNLIVPANKKLYFVYNNTASGQVTVKVSGQTGVSVPNGEKVLLVCNGTDVVNAVTYIADLGSNSLSVTNLVAFSAIITTLTSTSAGITTLSGTSANITTLSGTNFSATSLTLTNALRISQGGTGLSATPTNGQLLTGNGTGYTLSTLNGGPGVGITNNAGSITITATGTGFIASVNATSPLQSTGTQSITISLPSASNGQLLIGNGSGFSVGGLTAGTGVSITNSAGSITISTSNIGLPTVTVTASTAITAVAGFNYVLTGASTVTVTLPASPTISDTVYITVANDLSSNVVARNGNNIQGIAEDMTLDAPYASAQLRYTNPTKGWVMV